MAFLYNKVNTRRAIQLHISSTGHSSLTVHGNTWNNLFCCSVDSTNLYPFSTSDPAALTAQQYVTNNDYIHPIKQIKFTVTPQYGWSQIHLSTSLECVISIKENTYLDTAY